jgi:hypothetical protein
MAREAIALTLDIDQATVEVSVTPRPSDHP